jgi:TIR domain
MASVFMSYSHADEAMRDRLEVHLSVLKRQGTIETWHDRRIVPGARLDASIMAEVDTADVFLFLLSADFLASNYCYEVEMGRALERAERHEAVVIPVILHQCDWLGTPLASYMALPKDGKPIAKFSYLEDGYMEVVDGIRRAVATLSAAVEAPPSPRSTPAGRRAGPALLSQDQNANVPHPRSSNLAIRKTFSDVEQHSFLEDGFEFIARFFEESLEELARRNPGVEGKFRRNSADAFTALAFKAGKRQAQCKITLGGMFGYGISYSNDTDGRGINENLTVRADDQGLMFDAMMSSITGRPGKGMTPNGAAEHLWAMFIQPLQEGRR